MKLKLITLLGLCMLLSCTASKSLRQTINIKDLGAIGDGIHDNTAILQKALDKGGSIYIPAGIYLTEPLKYYSNTEFFGQGDSSVIKLKFRDDPITTTIQSILYAGNLDRGPTENVSIHSLTFDGNRDGINWTKVNGDGNGNGISTWGTHNLKISNVIIRNCWTDGLFLCATRRSKEFYNTVDFFIENIRIRNCGRQGVSVISAENGSFRNIKISDINRTAPRAGFDFEPNTLRDKIANIKVIDTEMDNTGQGIIVAGVSIPSAVQFENCTIRNVTSQYSLAVTNARNISFSNTVIDNTHGKSKYATVFVGSAEDILFDRLTVKNSKGVAAIQVDPYTRNLKTKVLFRNFDIIGFNHSALYVIDGVDELKFENGKVLKESLLKSPYAVAVLHSDNITMKNINMTTTSNPYYIDSGASSIEMGKIKFATGVSKSKVFSKNNSIK